MGACSRLPNGGHPHAPDIYPRIPQIEAPFIRQLQAQGWEYLEGDVDAPYLTERVTFRQVLLTSRLRASLRRINLDDAGRPWLDQARVVPDYGARRQWLADEGGAYDL